MGPMDMHSEPSAFNPNEHRVRLSKGALACIVNSEIGALLAVMRRNVRWGSHYVADDDQLEHSLVHSLKELRKQIFSRQHQWRNINPTVYLQPFLDVIQSDETGAPITGAALSSVYKILTLHILDIDNLNVEDAMHLIIDAVTSCRFEVTDPASEEVVLVKILQVLLACMKSKASVKLSDQHVCTIINTCFRVVHQASSKGELLQRIARHTMHELIRCIFSHLLDIDSTDYTTNQDRPNVSEKVIGRSSNCSVRSEQFDNGNPGVDRGSQSSIVSPSSSPACALSSQKNENKIEGGNEVQEIRSGERSMAEPFGVSCMVEIFHFLCSLLNVVEYSEISPRSNPMAYDEDVPLFALGLINSAIELSGPSISKHHKLLVVIQDVLFRNLMRFGLSTSPLILSTVCSIVFNLYHHMRTELKVQIETFFSCVLLRLAQSKHGFSYQQQEVALEALVDLCRQESFMTEIYANFDCDTSCNNLFEDVVNLLSKNAFPVNGPLSAMHILALDGLISMIQGMSVRLKNEVSISKDTSVDINEYMEFWMMKCENYSDPKYWIPFVQKMKHIKRRLTIGADHFNRDSKKGLEFLQGMNLLPHKLDPQSVACFFRYTSGLDKNLIGEFLGNHDEFCIHVLHEFTKTFDFHDMNLDTALRIFLGTFRLPGESQKIQRVLEAFSERYYEQSPHILCDKDAALVLSYSLILLNTDQHNVQIKRKMTEDDFIRNNRHINGGEDLPRELLSELYHSISENEIQMIPDQGGGSMTLSHWINLMHKSMETTPFIICDSMALLDYDMFAILSGPTVAAMSVVFGQAEQDGVLQTCIDGFLTVAKISAFYHFDDLLDDLVVSLCKFTTLITLSSVEDAIILFGDDTKARLATEAVFGIANKYGDHIRCGWKNIVDCVLSLHILGFFSTRLATDAADALEPCSDVEPGKSSTGSSVLHMPYTAARKSSGLISRFSQLLSFDMEEVKLPPTEEQLAAHQQARETVQKCHINSIITESKFLQAESLLQLVKALILAANQLDKGTNSMVDEDTAVICLELLIAITLNNRDRIMLIWEGVHEHIANIIRSCVMPCILAEKAVFGLLKICQRLLPYKENLTHELLKSLQLVLKLDARVADAYCEQITQEVLCLVKANANHIRSHLGWSTIISLLSITARHPEASEVGFEALVFIMSDGVHLLPSNYALCVDAARQFAESLVGEVDRSVSSLDMMGGSVACLVRWSQETKNTMVEEAAIKVNQDIEEMWLRLIQGLKKVCLDQREAVRNHAILMLQRSITGVSGTSFPYVVWQQCFDMVIFTLLDDLLEIAEGSSLNDYQNMEGTLVLAIKLMSKAFLMLMHDLSQQLSFCKLWLPVLSHMDRYMKVKFRRRRSEEIHELVPQLLKNTLLVMKTTGILTPSDDTNGDSFWQLTWLHVKNISPLLQSEVFSPQEIQHVKEHMKAGRIPVTDGSALVALSETTA